MDVKKRITDILESKLGKNWRRRLAIIFAVYAVLETAIPFIFGIKYLGFIVKLIGFVYVAPSVFVSIIGVWIAGYRQEEFFSSIGDTENIFMMIAWAVIAVPLWWGIFWFFRSINKLQRRLKTSASANKTDDH